MTRDCSAARNPTGKTVPRTDRHLTEDVSRVSLPDDALDPVDELHRLDPALQDCEERPVVTLVCRVLARREGDVGGNTREAVTGVHLEGGKNGNRSNLLSRDHARHLLWFAGPPACRSCLDAAYQATLPPYGCQQ